MGRRARTTMNAARVIHGIAAFMLLGLAFLLLREFGIAYKYGQIGVDYARYEKELREDALPWLSALCRLPGWGRHSSADGAVRSLSRCSSPA